jgi:chromosomal replication initiation ATPase DnaA
MIKQEKIKATTFVAMNTTKAVSLEAILQASCRLTVTTMAEAKSSSRETKFVYTRQLYSYVAVLANQRSGSQRQDQRLSLSKIGAFINCDHSTVLHSKRKIEDLLELYKDVQADVDTIKRTVMIPDTVFNTQLIDDSKVGYYNTPERKRELVEMFKV